MHAFRASLIAVWLLASSFAHAGSVVPGFQWATQPLIGTGNSSAHGVTKDASGNTLLCGTFTDTLNLPSGALRATGNTIPGNTDVFVMKLSPNGSDVWARNGGNATLNTNEVGYAVAVDPPGNVYVTGEYNGAGPTTFGGIQIDNNGGGAFAVKYDPTGAIQWATSLATIGVGNSIATSGSGLVYVFIGGFPTSSVKKLDASNGSEIDSWNFNGLVPDQIMKLSVDLSGNVIISGSFTNTVDLDPGPGVSHLVGDASGDGFIAKYDANGTLLWALKLASIGADVVKSHALSAGGDAYFCGTAEFAATIGTASTTAGGQVVGRIASAGDALWMRRTTSLFFGSDLDLFADLIGVDENGDYYISGVGLPGGGDIGPFTIPAVNHFHVVRYADAGTVTYAKFATCASGFVIPEAFAVYGTDLYNVAGSMVGETVFDAFTLPDINGFPRPAPFSAQVGDVTSPVLASLATAEASPDRVRLRWYVTGLEGMAHVERRRGAEEWVVLGEAAYAGPDYLVYEDRDVAADDRLSYRLVWQEEGITRFSDAVEVVVPRAQGRLELVAAPNPASASLDARLGLPGAGEATLAMHDLLGREVLERRLQADAAGRMIVRLRTSDLPAGLYWLSLRQGDELARTRVSIVR